MSPIVNISDVTSVNQYASRTGAILSIKSVVSSISVRFPAFLTDFSQTFDATWNTEDVFGRMDPIATYQNTKRTMSLSFDVPAGSVGEAKKNLHRTQNLVKMVYPVYSNIGGNNILSKPPLVRIRFANLIKGSVDSINDVDQEQQVGERTDTTNLFASLTIPEAAQPTTSTSGLLGWISGLNWSPDLEMGMFTQNKQFYPKTIKISFSFNVLHETTLNQAPPNLNSWPFGA